MASNSTTSNNAPKSNLPALAFFPNPQAPHAFPKIADGEPALVPQCLPSIQSQAHAQASVSMLVLCNAKAWRGFAPKAEEQQGVMSPSQGGSPLPYPIRRRCSTPRTGLLAVLDAFLSICLSLSLCVFSFFLSGGVMGLVK